VCFSLRRIRISRNGVERRKNNERAEFARSYVEIRRILGGFRESSSLKIGLPWLVNSSAQLGGSRAGCSGGLFIRGRPRTVKKFLRRIVGRIGHFH
jgi:hypothetical protein